MSMHCLGPQAVSLQPGQRLSINPVVSRRWQRRDRGELGVVMPFNTEPGILLGASR